MPVQNSRFVRGLREGNWVTPSRVRGYAAILGLAYLLGLAAAICRAEGWFMPRYPRFSTEFISFYAAGKLTLLGQAESIYRLAGPVASFVIPTAHGAMQQAVSGDPHVLYFGFFYPPVFLLPCALLARLPYVAAYLTWVGLTLALLVLALRALRGTWRGLWMLPAYLAIILNAAVGENAFLSAALLGGGLLSLQRTPVRAGLLLGVLCYKPHFLAPALLFLLIGRQWRALCAAIATSAALCLLTAAIFGWRIWVTYFTVTVPHAAYVFDHAGVSYALLVTPFSTARLLGMGIAAAKLFQAACTLFALYTLFATRNAAPNIRAAMLCASFPLMLSIMLGYDLTLVGLSFIFLLREGVFRPYEKSAAAAMALYPLTMEIFRNRLHIPVDLLIPASFMLALLCHARHAASATISGVNSTPVRT